MILTLEGFPGGPRKFRCRDGTSDINMANQAFRDMAFLLSGLKRWPDIQRWLAAKRFPLIVDAGANCGSASVAMCHLYPSAWTIALEPEKSNYDALVDNTDGLRVTPLHAALSGRSGFVTTLPSDAAPGSHAAFRTAYALDGIPAMTMHDVIAKAGAPHDLFLAKIDIEGAEADVFSGDVSWIDRFPVVMVELHDWLYPRERLAQSFLKAVAPLDRDFVLHGEHVVSIRNEP